MVQTEPRHQLDRNRSAGAEARRTVPERLSRLAVFRDPNRFFLHSSLMALFCLPPSHFTNSFHLLFLALARKLLLPLKFFLCSTDTRLFVGHAFAPPSPGGQR